MARPREPVELILFKGKKHLTKAEIAARRSTEITPALDDITPPAFLTAAQKKHFSKIAFQLQKIRIMGETDTETLARYVVAQELYRQASKDMQEAMHIKLQKDDNPLAALAFAAKRAALIGEIAKVQDRYFKQAQTAARDLGLTISSRCKLTAPVNDAEAEKVNKFEKLTDTAGDS